MSIVHCRALLIHRGDILCQFHKWIHAGGKTGIVGGAGTEHVTCSLIELLQDMPIGCASEQSMIY